VLLPLYLLLADEEPLVATREQNKGIVAKFHQRNVEQFTANTNILVLPGLIASRETKTVTFYAESTGLDQRTPIEFFLIGEQSGHDYESVAVALAGPEDIRTGLRFIGMPTGMGTDPGALRFWPRGERVNVTMDGVRIESFILNSDTGRSLPAKGLVFTGSTMIDSMDEDGRQVLAAAGRDPYSIAANYNEPESVLDVPWQAPQESVYNRQSLNSEHLLPRGKLLKVTMEPENKDGKRRVLELDLHLSIQPDTATQSLNDVLFTVTGAESQPIRKALAIDDMPALFSGFNDEGRDSHVTIHFDDGILIGVIREICVLIRSIDTENGIHVAPPLPDHLYYKAFVPPEGYRKREGRPSQPPELQLSMGKEGTAALLTEIEEIWKDGQVDPELKATAYVISSPEALETALKKIKDTVPAIIVFAEAGLSYGELMRFVRGAIPTHPMVHVFVGEMQ